MYAVSAASSADSGEKDERSTFNQVEEQFFETAQARTDAYDEYLDVGYESGRQATGTMRAVAGRGSRCHSIYR